MNQEKKRTSRTSILKRRVREDKNSTGFKLERVLGITVKNNASLASDPNTQLIAYPAGCTTVLLNTTTGRQENHIINTSKKTITTLAFSSCGRYLVTGESGHQPAVRIWDLQITSDPGPQNPQIAEFFGHKFGINCVSFSPTNKYVVSVGSMHDMVVNVWDWKANTKLASNKVSTKVKSIAFAENGSYFVTAGNRHVKFWYLENQQNKFFKEVIPLIGRSAILCQVRNNYFCDVACGKGEFANNTYIITRSGLLCELNNRRFLEKWVELRTNKANCIAIGENFIFVGCAEGIVRCFNPHTLNYITTLPRTHYLGVDVALGLSISHLSTVPPDAKYPDVIAVTYDEIGNKVSCVYHDHSVYVWDVKNIRRVGTSHSFLYHSGCIWGVEMAPSNSPLPPGTFLTCSSDDTIRAWTLEALNEQTSRGIYRRNIYSNELIKVVYVDNDLKYLKDLDTSIGNIGNNNKQPDNSLEERSGVRSIRLSPDGKLLASGSRTGDIRIHDTSTMNEQIKLEAHNAEVLCLEFSNVTKPNSEHKFLASTSRDRLVHVFEAENNFDLVQTLDDHSSSITSVRFASTPDGNLQMITCSADKSIIFRTLINNSYEAPQFQRRNIATGKTTLFDMEVDANQKHILTACQDRNIRVYNVNTGKPSKCFKGSTSDDGTVIKVVLDKSGTYLATSCTDKSLSIYDYYTQECMATMCGHSELVTGVQFTNDCKRLISTSGDGCVFVWKVPHDMVVTMHARLSQQAMRQGKSLDNRIFSDSSNEEVNEPSIEDSNYKFVVESLPTWAQKHMSGTNVPENTSINRAPAPKGRWAQRAEKGVDFKPLYTDSDFPSSSKGSDESKDSSLENVDGNLSGKIQSISKRIVSTQIIKEQSEHNVTFTRGIGNDSLAPIMLQGDPESLSHDADIDSDQDNTLLYYPSETDSTSGSKFTVNQINHQESEDDDEDGSTPSGDNTDRNPLSLFSESSESLEQLSNRESFLDSAFVNLNFPGLDFSSKKSSLSAQFHQRTSSATKARNTAVIKATQQIKNDSETLKKREDLKQTIVGIKKKLQSIGYKSPLKNSQSIMNLTYIVPEKESPNKSVNKKDESLDSSLRRVCSLSDLSVQPVPNETTPKIRRIQQVVKDPYIPLSPMTRSSSMGVLNRKKSLEENKQNLAQSRLMRPTISSQNKTKNNKNKNMAMRKKLSQSASNLLSVGLEESSSEEIEDPPVLLKPPVPRRLRVPNNDSSISRNADSSLEKSKYSHTHNFKEKFDSFQDLDGQTPIQSHEEAAFKLTKVVTNVVNIIDRLIDSNDPQEHTDVEKKDMIESLETSLFTLLKPLHNIFFEKLVQTNTSMNINQTDTVKKFKDLLTRGNNNFDQISRVNIMEQYANILLEMMQQKNQDFDT